jgi:predicted permease
MRAHLDLYTEELIGRGLTPDAARREARLRFGNPRARLEETNDLNRLPVAEVLWRDVRYAARVLRRTPAFTMTAMTTLALVVGVNTAVYSLADALLIRALPYPEPDRLAMLEYRQHSSRGEYVARWMDGAMWEAVRDAAPSLDAAVMGTGGNGANLFVGEAAEFVRQQRVSAGFFRVLGVPPARGRAFSADEDRQGGPLVTVLSHRLWQRTFSSDPDIVGRPILLRGEPYIVIGVMPPDFVSTMDVDAWTPLRPAATGEGGGTNYQIIARLKPGATWPQARGELMAANAAAFRLLGQPQGITRELGLTPMQDALVDGVREPIVMLSWAVGAVLLIACVNLTALLLARGGTRSKEIATRMALGSGRAAVIRQLMVEAGVLAIAGGLAGILVAYLALQGLQLIGGDTFEAWRRATIDGRVLAVTLGLSMLTALVFGLVPALQAGRTNVQHALIEGGSRHVAGRARPWPRRLLVVTEVALSVVLLVTAGLLVRTFLNLQALEPGFNPRGLVTASVSLQDARYRDAVAINRLFDDSLRRLRSSPGIAAAAVSLELPYDRMLNSGFRFMDDAAADARTANVSYITPGFLTALELPLRRGRDIQDTDAAGSTPVVLVNETFERVYSKSRSVLGRRIRVGGVEREIVGVTGDVQQRASFSVDGVAPGPLVSLPIVFQPAAQTTDGQFRSAHTWFAPAWTVRARDPGAAVPALRQAIAAVDPRLPLSSSRTMTSVMAAAMAPQRLLMTIVAVLAGAAVFLAAIGIHGLIAHAVAERRREFGIRIALGATAGQTVRRVALGGLAMAAAGALAGALLSIPATRLVQSFLWGVEPSDPRTYGVVAAGVLLVAAAASLIPALTLFRLDPAQTLRN